MGTSAFFRGNYEGTRYHCGKMKLLVLNFLALCILGLLGPSGATTTPGQPQGTVLHGKCKAATFGDVLNVNKTLPAAKCDKTDEDGTRRSLLGNSRDLMAGHNCPHSRFIWKHLCNWCRSDNDALAFSKERRVGGDRTNRNTVIMGNPTFSSDGHYCRNSETKVVSCTISTGYCTTHGNLCITKHDLSNGHLYYRDIQCR